MARKALDVNIRIERKEKQILKLKDEMEKAQDEYEKLILEREMQEKETLYEAYKKGKRTLQQMIDYAKGKADL